MSSEIEVTIRIPAPPEGWRYDGYRHGHPGEQVYACGRWAVQSYATGNSKYPVAVKLPPPWEPSPALAEVLRPGWIAMDISGDWYWHTTKPSLDHVGDWESYIAISMVNINRNLLPSVPFNKSLFKIGEPQQ